MQTPGIRLFDFAQAEAYARRFAFLTPALLPRGVVDLAQDLPHLHRQPRGNPEMSRVTAAVAAVDAALRYRALAERYPNRAVGANVAADVGAVRTITPVFGSTYTVNLGAGTP